MCVISMVIDAYGDRWWERYERVVRPHIDIGTTVPAPQAATKEDLDELRAWIEGQMEEFRDLVERARAYDAEHNQPDCELESKKARIRKLADELGIEISFL